MSIRHSAFIAGLAGVAMAAGLTVAGGGIAYAATPPPWEPDPASLGTITFYDAQGNVVTSGTTDSPPSIAYVVGSSGYADPNDKFAAIAVAQPNPDRMPPFVWNQDTLGGFTPLPLPADFNGGVPANIVALSQTHPVAVGVNNTDLTINDFISEFPNTDPSGLGCAYSTNPDGTLNPAGCTNTDYQNRYQIRILTDQGGIRDLFDTDVADILVDPITNTWTQVYPIAPTATANTKTTMSVSPKVKTAGQIAFLGAKVSDGRRTAPFGSVTWTDNGTVIAGPTAVDGSGSASAGPVTFTSGSHSVVAHYTPADPTQFNPSDSKATTFKLK